MRFVWLFLIFSFSMSVFATKAKPTAKTKRAERMPAATIWSRGLPSDMREVFPDKRIVILDGKMQDEARRKSGLLPPKEREAVFNASGVAPLVAKWDVFARDVLVMDARTFPMKTMRRKYPAFSEAQIAKLQAELGKTP
ncbi:MAG TPA: hypothetical protein PKC28_04990 [Bdellovibrionales bacterium]|nr:hypothetical protein [Bdellovibrionales bacterium]